MPLIELEPIKEDESDFDEIEAEILRVFRKEIYEPLMKELGQPSKKLRNAKDDLLEAIRSGRIEFYRGSFKGRLDANISKELKRLGAKWDRTQGLWKIPQSSLPLEIRMAISASQSRFTQVLEKIDQKLAQILPDQIVEKMKLTDLFSKNIFKVEKRFKQSVKAITITPNLSDKEREKIADEWSNNLKTYAKNFTEEQVKKLREDVEKNTFAGNRYEGLVAQIQQSYGVSQNKAKFLARQETSLLMAKYKETRYSSIGITEYIWCCVAGSPKHPVRPMHKIHEGKTFRWSDPPVTDEKGNKNNPGQDYNCRCFAKPVVKF